MWTAERAFSRVYPKLIDLLADAKADCGCMMTAVKQVAKRVGASEHWVRRVTGRYGEVKIQAHHLINVVREHVRLRRRRKNTNASAGHPAEASRVRPWKLGGIGSRNTCSEASAVPGHVDDGSGLPRP